MVRINILVRCNNVLLLFQPYPLTSRRLDSVVRSTWSRSYNTQLKFKMAPKIRKSSKPYKILDFNPCILSDSQLPTNRDVYQHYLHVRNQLHVRRGDLRQTIRPLSSLVMQDVFKVWERSNMVQWEAKEDINSNTPSDNGQGSIVWVRSNIVTEKTILKKSHVNELRGPIAEANSIGAHHLS